jgi:NADPH-dependent glutamate synthase beta subunit-like oxidoreductase
MEAKNFAGAARLIREKNPFGEVCGLVCTPGRTCQKDCYRRDFAGVSVRIAELQAWVCARAGQEGWIRLDGPATGPKIAVVGGGPSALSCAYYLSLTGCIVNLIAPEIQPGGALWLKGDSDPLIRDAIQREVQGILSAGTIFEGEKQLGIDIDQILEQNNAVYLADAGLMVTPGNINASPGIGTGNALDQKTGQLANQPKLFIGEEFLNNGISVVEAVANGRKAACSIEEFLAQSG